MSHTREKRVHWNAATGYPHLEAHLLDLLEETTPLPTDLCLLVLASLGESFDTCLPLSAGCAHLAALRVAGEDEDSSNDHAIQLREGAYATTTDTDTDTTTLSFELPFRGGGYLDIRGELFYAADPYDGETVAAWYALPYLISPDQAATQSILYSDEPSSTSVQPVSESAGAAAAAASSSPAVVEQSPHKRRRMNKAVDPRWRVHEQAFAYYQLVPGFGVNLFRDPCSQDTLGMVSGVCLVYGKMKPSADGRGPAIYPISRRATQIVDPQNIIITSFFRGRGVCEWSAGRCNRHAVASCTNGCCCTEHCAAAVEHAVCAQHA